MQCDKARTAQVTLTPSGQTQEATESVYCRGGGPFPAHFTLMIPPVYCATDRSTSTAVSLPQAGWVPRRYFLAHSTRWSCSTPTPASTMRSGV